MYFLDCIDIDYLFGTLDKCLAQGDIKVAVLCQAFWWVRFGLEVLVLVV